MASSIAQVVGANARRLRLDAKVTLDEFAQAARFCGLSAWRTSGRVGDFEAGRVGTSLETLYAVALALQQVTGQPVSLADLFAGDGPVQINDELNVECSALRAAMSGEPVTGETDAYRRLSEGMDKLTRAGIARLPEWKRLPKPVRRNVDPLDWLRVDRTLREADVRMCKSIGVDRELGALLMARLWGRPFSAERDQRAEADANAQRKGQISRQLKAELEEAISHGDD